MCHSYQKTAFRILEGDLLFLLEYFCYCFFGFDCFCYIPMLIFFTVDLNTEEIKNDGVGQDRF